MNRSIGRKMSFLMGLTLSLFLSLTGTLSSGNFTFPGFLMSFAVSFVISMVIGLLVPMGRVTAALDRRLGLGPGKLSTNFFDALVSDLIYTPLITFCMVTLAYKIATSHGAPLRYGPMLGKSMAICFAVGYVLIFIFTPLYLRLLLGKEKKNAQKS